MPDSEANSAARELLDQPARLQRSLLAWYKKHSRELPWRNSTDPYRVWVSEIMLQQTQVATVLSYYDRFLLSFPTITSLAAAEEEQVLHLWQGLGYYRRARNLHTASKIVIKEYDGIVPDDPKLLSSLPGLGRYTANAILSFAGNRPLPILEANTIRLWTRVFALPGDPGRSPLKNQLWEIAEKMVPQQRPADFNQAIMDLGATVCVAGKPQCEKCPLTKSCKAYAQQNAEQYPQLPARTKTVDKNQVAVVVWSDDAVLVRKRPPHGQWGNLWEFPTVDKTVEQTWEQAAWQAVEESVNGTTGYRLESPRATIKHGIMHYRITLKCFDVVTSLSRPTVSRGEWVCVAELSKLPFSSPQRKIARLITESSDSQPTHC